MIYDEIIKFFGQQNFALVSSNIPGACILRNSYNGENIFCVIINADSSSVWSTSQISGINNQLLHLNGSDLNNNVLFITVTSNSGRDRYMTQIPNVNLWLADTSSHSLLIFENQPDDFFGLKAGIESCLEFNDNERRGLNISGKNFPYVTAALMAVNILYFIFLAASGDINNTSYLLKMGANYSPLVFDSGQFWRIITSAFMHLGITHLLYNMLSLAVAGYYLEKVIGHWKFLLIYMLGVIGSGVVSAAYYYIANEATVSAGASGAIYALIGTIMVLSFLRRGRKTSPAALFLRFGLVIIFVFSSSFLQSGIDHAAHIGGFLFGILLGFLFCRETNNKKA